MANSTIFPNLSDQELVTKMKENSDYLGIVYKRCKANCLGFMRKMTGGSISDGDFEDIFQDASIILYEKIIKGDFILTCSLQTYLNSVCRFQLLNTIGKSKLTTNYQENSSDDDDENPNGYNSAITDRLDDIEHSNEPQFLAIESALEKMKLAGNHCYELLTLFWYHKKSHDEIAKLMNYSNDKTSKKQKSGCQEKLRKLAFNELNK
jgi:RNA polymerase sigma factor (sigma-70 family)